MKPRDRYLKIVEWSEEDNCYIGRCPGLMLGGVHGRSEQKVYEELGEVVDEWIQIHEKDGIPLPAPTAAREYSGKFNLRAGKSLHELLAIAALKEGESLNSFVLKKLKEQVNR